MVDESSDPDVVTARIIRETRESVALQKQKEAEAKLYKVEYLESKPISQDAVPGTLDATTASEVQPVERDTIDPIDANAGYRRGRLIVVAVLVLVVFWAWVQQRQGMARGVS